MNKTISQDNITAFWDAIAQQYDAPSFNNVVPVGSREYIAWVEAVRPFLPAHPSNILDVGTGTGFLAGIVARLGHNVTAIDLSSGMLNASTLPKTGLTIMFALGDAVNPAFPACSFDAIVSRSLLWTLREPVTAFRNWYQLLRPGGCVLAIYDLVPSIPPAVRRANRVPGLFDHYYNHVTRAELPAMRLTDHALLLEIATEAGFHTVTTSVLDVLRGWWETSSGADAPNILVCHRSLDT